MNLSAPFHACHVHCNTTIGQLPKEHGTRLTKISNSRHWGEPLDLTKVPARSGSMLL